MICKIILRSLLLLIHFGVTMTLIIVMFITQSHWAGILLLGSMIAMAFLIHADSFHQFIVRMRERKAGVVKGIRWNDQIVK